MQTDFFGTVEDKKLILDFIFSETNIDKNIVKGAYTTRVLRKRISKEEREQMDKESGFIFENE